MNVFGVAREVKLVREDNVDALSMTMGSGISTFSLKCEPEALPYTTPFPKYHDDVPMAMKFRFLGGDVIEPNDFVLKPGVPDLIEKDGKLVPNQITWFNANPLSIHQFKVPFPESMFMAFGYILTILWLSMLVTGWALILLPLWPFIPGCYFSMRIRHWGLYMGWKTYGVDSDAYKDWLPHEDVYSGSYAMCVTMRMSTKVGK
jgi:hypothetical protein